ncbi:MAG: hypothetical protein GF401_04905 [Chitinivibrionales bacterium]|nr:hypothetical protein [Chitinivibrionales bacterium]
MKKHLLNRTFVLLALFVCRIFGQQQIPGSLSELKESYKKSQAQTQSLVESRNILPGLAENDFAQTSGGLQNQIILDKRIDPEKYTLGPGDEITISVWGNSEKNYVLLIDSEGRLQIPLVGSIHLAGKSLAEAKKEIKDEMMQIHKDVKITIILSAIRRFKCYVVGEVKQPGGYIITGVTRVSDLIDAAGGINGSGKHRYIVIENQSKATRYADLDAFMKNNIIEANPYLVEGDRVFVPKTKDYISLRGAVQYEGNYDILDTEPLSSVIQAAGGIARGADTSKILVTRFVDKHDQLEHITLSLSETGSFLIKKDDRIFIPYIPEYRVHRKVQIRGEVQFPGTYPIQKDKTTLLDIINMAGGLTDDAYLAGSKIVRRTFTKVGDREFERLKTVPVQALTPLERSYLKSKLTEEEGIVSLDFDDLINNGGGDYYNITLRDNDVVTIARKSLTVKVTGAVVSPGLVSYKDGAHYKYYINKAGGFNTDARKRSIMIIKGGTEIWLKPRKAEKIEAGDAIWVPEKPYQDTWALSKDIILILGSIGTLLMSYITISTAIQD